MTALNRKLVRDLFQMKGQATAIGLVIGCGVAMLVMLLNTLRSMEQAQSSYYVRARFAEIFANVKRAPNSLAARIGEIPGVARADTRVVQDVSLDVPGLAEPAVGRLISIPDRRAPVLNDLYMRSGRYIEPDRPGEVLVNEAFAVAHKFKPGDTLLAILNGRRQQLNIVGIVLSPEYIIQIRRGDLFPDDKRYGVFWMSDRELASAFDMEGAFNDVSLTLMPDASEPDVIRRLDRLLEPFGGLGAYGRSGQVSHTFLSDEIHGLRTMATVAPAIFLGVAAFLLNVVLTRLITTQREQIAIIKAFGYTPRHIAFHYIQLVLIIAIGGALLGVGFGTWFGFGMTELYRTFYRFPLAPYEPNFGIMLLGVAVAIVAAMLGVFTAVRNAARLPAAEAMRPQPPANFRPTLLERVGLQRAFSPAARMILRNLERKPLKAVLASFGIALAVAVLIVGSFGEDAINYMMDFQFRRGQQQDMSTVFVEPSAPRALHELGHLPGVGHAEPFRSLPVRLRIGHRSRRVAIMGLDPTAGLFRLLDESERPVALPREGLLLSSKLADLLGVGIGDPLEVEVLEGARPRRTAAVAGLITEFSGLTAYMNIHALNRLAREGDNISGAFMTVDTAREGNLFTTLKTTPKIAGVTVKRAALASFRDTIAENILKTRSFVIVFACIIAFGVVYNSARISLSERSRELATLRVIGFTRAEISLILVGELAILTLAALPLGMLLGWGLSALMSLSFDTELYRIPLVIAGRTYAFAAVVVLTAALVSGLAVRRQLDQLNLVAVLKATD